MLTRATAMWRTSIAGGIASSRPIAAPEHVRVLRSRRAPAAACGAARGGSGAARKRTPCSAASRPRQVLAGGAVAARVEHPREQLLGGFAGLDVEQLLVLAGEHQPRLQLQQGGDQDDEFGGALEVELAGALEVVQVGQHDLRQLELEQVDLFAQDQRQQQVEGPAEDLEVEVQGAHRGRRAERSSAHRTERRRRPLRPGAAGAPDAHQRAYVGDRLAGDRVRALRPRRRGSPRAGPRRRAARRSARGSARGTRSPPRPRPS